MGSFTGFSLELVVIGVFEGGEKMKYKKACIFDFDEDIPCPLFALFGEVEVDGALCGACTDIRAFRGMRAQVIAQLLMTYQDEEKAKEVFERVFKCVKEW